MTDLGPAELALIAERRIWRVLVGTDRDFCGLAPSAIRDHAQARLDHLERCLAHLPTVTDDVLDDVDISTSQRDRAFGEAALAMHATMQMIKTNFEGAAW